MKKSVSRKRLFIISTLLLFLLIAVRSQLFAADKLMIMNVNVIDIAGGPVKTNATVIIQGDRISSIEPASVDSYESETKIDGRGKYLIPGLWDMHVHWYLEEYLPLFIVNGITGVRQMFGRQLLLKWRDRSGPDALIPRELVGSPIVDGPRPTWSGSWVVHDAEEAATIVSRAKNEKYDFLKIYNGLSRDAFFEIARKSKEIGLPFCGHLPYSVTIREASEAGQKSVEHLYGFLEACSKFEMELKNERARIAKGNPLNAFKKETREKLAKINRRQLDSFDPERAAELFKVLANNRTFVCPTLNVNRVLAYADDPKLLKNPLLSYMPKTIRRMWEQSMKFRATASADEFKMDRAIYEKEVSLIPLMQRAGVKILAGTDVLNMYCYPGFSLHEELSLLVRAGLSPLQALQAATLNAAEFAGQEKLYGTIEEGKMADLVLLEENPLEKISNTKKIAAVIFQGKLYEKKELEKQLSRIQKLSK